ncbi:hypothetical protein Poli38472_011372 [Pythium oligandrum]|uniref:Uncharacterized protein n=1 Tax=Pythium oligandrum TaxID=41045 RepID=A0A8K1CJA4_PYTOL|nr:hypothetical protein Poli38472_011372 [Pythium oligandrum]|eukprot:TMW64492.1 hypothetical protein Poli38472_011372 [Pythium oligandrum]
MPIYTKARVTKTRLFGAILWVMISIFSITDPLRVLFAVLSRLQPGLGVRKWDGATEYTLPADYKNSPDVEHLQIKILDGTFDQGKFDIYWLKSSMAKKEHVYVFVGELTAKNGTSWEFPDEICLNQWSATEIIRLTDVDLTTPHMLDKEWFPCYVEVRYDGTFVPVQQFYAGEYMCREVALWTLHDYDRTWFELFVPNPDNKLEVLSLEVNPQQHKTAKQWRYPHSTFRIGGGGAMINSKLFMNQKYLVFEEEEVQRCSRPAIWKDGHLRQFVDSRANLSLIVDGYFELTVRGLIYIYIVLMRFVYVYIPLYRYVRAHGFPVNGTFDPIHAGLRYGVEIALLAFGGLVSLDEIIGTFLMLHESRTVTYVEYLWLCTQACKILWIPVAFVTLFAIIVRIATGGQVQFRVSPDAYPLLVPFLVFYAGPRIVDSTPDLFQHYHATTAGLGHISNSAKSSAGGVRTVMSLLHIVSPVLWPCTLILLGVSSLQQFSGLYLLIPGYRGNDHNLRFVTERRAISHDLLLHEHAVGPNKFTQSLGLVLSGYERALLQGFDLPILVHRGKPILLFDETAAENFHGNPHVHMLSVIVAVEDRLYLHPLDLGKTKLAVHVILPLHWEYTSVPSPADRIREGKMFQVRPRQE